MSDLKQQIQEDIKNTMRAKDKQRLTALRFITAAIKQIEVDERIELSDEQVIGLLDKMAKQRRESISQYKEAKRDDLAEKEEFELGIIQTFLPQQLTEAEVEGLINQTIDELGASSMQDMGKVMGKLKPLIQGRADASLVSQKVKQLLTA